MISHQTGDIYYIAASSTAHQLLYTITASAVASPHPVAIMSYADLSVLTHRVLTRADLSTAD